MTGRLKHCKIIGRFHLSFIISKGIGQAQLSGAVDERSRGQQGWINPDEGVPFLYPQVKIPLIVSMKAFNGWALRLDFMRRMAPSQLLKINSASLSASRLPSPPLRS